MHNVVYVVFMCNIYPTLYPWRKIDKVSVDGDDRIFLTSLKINPIRQKTARCICPTWIVPQWHKYTVWPVRLPDQGHDSLSH